MGSLRLALLVLATLAAASTPARAGGISVMPTRLDFAADHSVQSLLLVNLSAETVTVETEVQVWPADAPQRQANDVVVTPGVVTLPPNQRIRVRVGLLRRPDGDREHAYRVYFTELPAPKALHAAGIGVRLRIGVPLFVAPDRADPQPLRWTARPAVEGWLLEAHNPGNVHARIGRATLVGVAGTAAPAGDEPLELPSPYVLARASIALERRDRPPAGARIRWTEHGHEHESAVALP